MVVNFGVNYLAVVVAAIVAMIIGFVWYSPPLFGKRYFAYLGITVTQNAPGNPGAGVLALAFVASLVNAWVLALFALNLGGRSVTDGVLLGVLAWLGFMATITAAQVLFEKRPWGYWLLNNGHNVIVQAILGAIVTVWR